MPATYPTIASAVADVSCSAIQVAAGTYFEHIVIARDLTIEGAGQGVTIVNGSNNGWVFTINQGVTATIRSLTVEHGHASGYPGGAGVTTSGTLTMEHVSVQNNYSESVGGGVATYWNTGNLTMRFCSVRWNRAQEDGGGVYNGNITQIEDSIIDGNTTTGGYGGGIANEMHFVRLLRTTVSNNSAYLTGGGMNNAATNGSASSEIVDSTFRRNVAQHGGGISNSGYNGGGTTIRGSTFTGNVASGYFGLGGGIWSYNVYPYNISNTTISGNQSYYSGAGYAQTTAYAVCTDPNYALTTFTNVTITGNVASADDANPPGGGGGVYRTQCGVRFINTIVSGNRNGAAAPSRDECSGAALFSSGHNLFGEDNDASGCPVNGSTDIVPATGVFASNILGPLADNGGPTFTHLPVDGGIAIDAGDDSVAATITTDQRGLARLSGEHVDIGSVEIERNTPPTAVAGGPYTVPEGGTVTLDASGSSDAETASSSLTYEWDLDNDTTYETSGAAATFSAAAIDGPATRTVGLRVCDEASACSTATATVTITNAAPTVGSFTGSTINEGGTATVSGTIADPGTADTFTVVVDWGAGAGTSTLTLDAGVHTFTASRTFADDDPTGTSSDMRTVAVTVTDDDGGTGSAQTAVTVSNVAPAITVTGASTATSGQPYSVSASYSDAGAADTHTATVDWGDGIVENIAATAGTIAATHTFGSAGSYTVTVCVTDDDGGKSCGSVAVTVSSAQVHQGEVEGGGLCTDNRGRGGFEVHAKHNRIRGELEFRSTLGRFHARVFTSFAISLDGRSAMFGGVGTDGRPFNVYVEDNGRWGRRDVFKLWIDGVLQTGSGQLGCGNIEIERHGDHDDDHHHDGHDR